MLFCVCAVLASLVLRRATALGYIRRYKFIAGEMTLEFRTENAVAFLGSQGQKRMARLSAQPLLFANDITEKPTPKEEIAGTQSEEPTPKDEKNRCLPVGRTDA